MLIAQQAVVKLGFKINTPLKQLGEIHTLQYCCVYLLTESIHAIAFWKVGKTQKKNGSAEQILGLTQILVFTCPWFLLPSLGKIKINKKQSQILIIQRHEWSKPAHLAEGKGGPTSQQAQHSRASQQLGQVYHLHRTGTTCPWFVGTLTPQGLHIPACTRGNGSVQPWMQFFARICTKTTCNRK